MAQRRNKTEVVEEQKQTTTQTKPMLQKIEAPEKPKPVGKQRFFIIMFSMSWFEDNNYKRVDDTLQVGGIYGFPSLVELKQQIPPLYMKPSAENVRDLNVFNVLPYEMSEEDFKDYTVKP